MTFTDKAVPINLQLFADGGASAGAAPGGDAGAAGTGSAGSQGDNAYRALNIPAKARHILDKMPKAQVNSSTQESENTENTETETTNTDGETPIEKGKTKTPFSELVKSEEYKQEAQEYFDSRIGRRLAKYKGLEADNQAMRDIIDKVNLRYGVNPESETFLTDFAAAVDKDTRLYEDEAASAGMTVDEFIKVKSAERIIAQNKIAEQNRQFNEMTQRHVSNLIQQAEAFKQKVPTFDLEGELQNPQFKKLVDPPELGGVGLPVETAFNAFHHNEIMQATLASAVNQASISTANAVQTNLDRPQENGLNVTHSDLTKLDPSKLKLEDFKRISEEFRRTGKKPTF